MLGFGRGHVAIAAAALAVVLAACADHGGHPAASPRVEQGPDFVVRNVKPNPLCFGLSALPEKFVADGAPVVADNRYAAKLAPDPVQRERDFRRWGRLTGYVARFAFNPPSSITKEERQELTDAEIREREAAVAREIGAAPFIGASCTVDLYRNANGASRAFAALTDDLRNPLSLGGPEPDVKESDAPELGAESAAIGQESPGSKAYNVLFRTRNVVAKITLVAPSGKDLATAGEELATAVYDRFYSRLERKS
ncbi:MAG: hypothetical protein HYS09_00105 [Chloroflexi bacterium]|nr:hypothetical protein [Chloroflexota bacterium]